MKSASKLSLLALLGCLGCTAAVAAEPSSAAAAPPLKINLDEFDALKKVVLLPNSQHLAYIDMGPHDSRAGGPPVVLIHGYTDNARDWVPLIPYLSKRFRLIVVDIRGMAVPTSPSAVMRGSTLPTTSSCCWIPCTSPGRMWSDIHSAA